MAGVNKHSPGCGCCGPPTHVPCSPCDIPASDINYEVIDTSTLSVLTGTIVYYPTAASFVLDPPGDPCINAYTSIDPPFHAVRIKTIGSAPFFSYEWLILKCRPNLPSGTFTAAMVLRSLSASIPGSGTIAAMQTTAYWPSASSYVCSPYFWEQLGYGTFCGYGSVYTDASFWE